MSFQIGKSVYESTGSKNSYFYLASGGNVYRVLPPMKSLAAKGQWFRYYGVHKGFVNSAGKYRPLASIEEYDFEKKQVKVHDPICDKYRDHLAKAKAAKEKGVPDEKIKEFMEIYVKPYDTDKKYYVNAVDQNGKIGVLVLPIKLFKQLRALCKEYEAKGIDLTGMKGVFLNFKKIQAFKGDPQTSYSVEIYKEQVTMNGELFEKPKVHEITEAFIIQLQNEAKDLSDLFKTPTATDLQLLADAQPGERGAIIDRIFGKSEKDDDHGPGGDEEDNSVGLVIPNTGGARVVGQVGLSGAELVANLPSMPTPGPATPPVTQQTADFLMGATTPAPAAPAAAAPAAASTLAPSAPTAPAATAAPAAPAQAAPAATEFDAMFATMFGVK